MATPAPATTTASAPAPTTVPAATTTTESAPAAAPVTTSTSSESSSELSSAFATLTAGVAVVYWVVLAIFLVLFHLGAAKLSYDLNQSPVLGVFSFLLAPIYYPYYAFVNSVRRESSFFGGRKRR